MSPEREITAELDAAELSHPETPPRERPDVVLALTFAAKTDLGRVRDNNEDKYDWWEPTDPLALANRGRLYAVADGMGGHAAGQIASEMALKAFGKAYYSGNTGSVEDALIRAVSQANAMVYDTGRAIPSRNGMGCTLVAVAMMDADAVVVWAGDSRAYLIRGGEPTRMTRDHSLVEEQVQLGILTPEEAAHHPHRNIITRSLGPEPSVFPEVVRYPCLPGDVIVLCSDGLSGAVKDEEIAEYAIAGPPTFACQSLIELANERGGPDNITVAIVRITDEAQPAGAPAAPPAEAVEEPKRKRHGFFRR